MSAISLTNRLIERGERRAQQLRPATLVYAGQNIPCSPGNKTFFQRLRPDGGGFQKFESLFLKILRVDLPMIPNPAGPPGAMMPIDLRRGQSCQVINNDPDCPVPGETFNLVIGESNQLTTTVLMLNVESVKA